MASMENAEKFLSQDQWQKLEAQLYPVCEKHCPWNLQCMRGIAVECPIQVYIDHLKRHTHLCSMPIRKAGSASVTEPSCFDELKKELAMSNYSRIKAKLRKISIVMGRIEATCYNAKLEHGLGEIRNLMEELHELDTMIRDVESMIPRGYFYTCLDRLTEKCRSLEEDIRWAMAEREVNERMDEER